ncbi:MAG: hypothetical protein ACRD0Z_16050, partial [Acidimicrobiales bacterium]
SISGRTAEEVTTALAELVRRGVLEVSADPLSPERGSYRFGQEMLRQVAYESLSRQNRKSRHLLVAAHLRKTFANDGEEIAEVIARHYLDALAAGPDDPDVPELRSEALELLAHAGERAKRAGSSTQAAASFSTAAELALVSATGDGGGKLRAAQLLEEAAKAYNTAADYDACIARSESARGLYLELGDERSAARAQSRLGSALDRFGRATEARTQHLEALEVLRPEPDADTVEALRWLAGLELFSGNAPEGDRLSAEALVLGQDLDVGDQLLGDLFGTRGLAHTFANRSAQAAAYYREAARLAEKVSDSVGLGNALLNLSDVLCPTDPVAAAEPARAAADHARRGGARQLLAFAIANLGEALLALGQWDEVAESLRVAVEEDGLGDIELLRCLGEAWLTGLRGDGQKAATVAESLEGMRASEGVQDQATLSLAQALAAWADGRTDEALHRARAVVAHAANGDLQVSHVTSWWAWPLAARAARALGDDATSAELVAILDAHPFGQLPPILRAERQLALACGKAETGDKDADAAFTGAVVALRRVASPYHLAHGLLDHASYLAHNGDTEAVKAAVAEAREIGVRLGCPPLVERADSLAKELAPT